MEDKHSRHIGKFFVKSEGFDYVMDDICNNNRIVIITLNMVFACAMLVLLALNLFIDIGLGNRKIVFAVLLVIAAATVALLFRVSKKNHRLIVLMSFITKSVMLAYGVYSSYLMPDQYTVAFIVFVGIISLTIVDRPERLGLVSLFWIVVCVVVVALCKNPSIRITDIINIVVYSSVTVVGGIFTSNLKVHNYVTGRYLKYIGEIDQLVGLSNRNSYELRMNNYQLEPNRSFGCIYIDVNGLHELNNEKGHNAGDEMLKCVGNALKNEFGKDSCFRIGGDEFVAFAVDISEAELENKIKHLNSVVLENDYDIAIGYEYQDKDVSVPSVVKKAEKKMRTKKKEFYVVRSLIEDGRRSITDDDMETLSVDNKLRVYRHMLEMLSQNTDDFLYVLDIKKDINWFFGPIKDRFSINESGSASNTTEQMLKIVHPDDRQALAEDLARVASGEQDKHDMNYRWIDQNGETVWISCRGTVIKDENGENVIMLGRVSEKKPQ